MNDDQKLMARIVQLREEDPLQAIALIASKMLILNFALRNNGGRFLKMQLWQALVTFNGDDLGQPGRLSELETPGDDLV